MNEEQRPFNQSVAIDGEQTRFALDAVGIGTWTIDPINKQISWDRQCRHLLCFTESEPVAYNQLLAHVHPQDIEQVRDAADRGLRSKKESKFDFSFRTVNPRNGEIGWVHCQSRGYVNADDRVYCFSGILRNVTHERQVAKARTDAESRFETAFSNASLGLVLTNEKGELLLANRAYSQMLGYTPEELVTVSYAELTHPDDRPRNRVVMEQLMRGDIPFFNLEKRYIRQDKSVFWIRINVTRLTDAGGKTSHLLGIMQDITREQEERRENSRLEQLVREAPELMTYMDMSGRVQFINQHGLKLLGVSSEEAVGKPVEYFSPPEEHGRIHNELLPGLVTGHWVGNLVNWHRPSGERIPVAVQAYSINDPITGEPFALVAIARDRRQEMRTQQLIEVKNHELELALEIGQLGTYRIDLANNTILASERARTWWRLPDGTSSLDTLLSKVLPVDQEKWNQVITQARFKETGGHHDLTYRVVNQESGEFRYLRSLGQAVYNDTNAAVTLSGTVQDITPQVLAQLRIEESEIRLLSAVDLADLGTWQIDLSTNRMDFSGRIRGWYGLDSDEVISLERSYEAVDPADRIRLEKALEAAVSTDVTTNYDVEYQINSLKTGRKRIIHARGKTYYDLFQEVYRVSGTMQDVTEQRHTELALEMEVQERTEKLAATNEEMAAVNEELAATNEELTETNQDLIRSNENLEQFAYIASHDLQEPLRKIQQFGDLLKTRHVDESTEDFAYLERMQSAASRMSLLIKDLLAFSRISTRQASGAVVSLAQVFGNVQASLAVAIEESKAQLDIDDLPTIYGDPTQLEQLFQNLLSNAIKFSRIDSRGKPTAPHIRVMARLVTLEELPPDSKPGRYTKTYYRIDVIDNGVGFEQKYTDRIFQVFQRLHGKNEFAGTGVGLAICQKVVTNHGGSIVATSQPGQGATFSVYLPDLM